MIITGVTLVRPRCGWGRLVLFIPKLFAGTYIAFIGLSGLLGGLLSWLLFSDPWSLSFGLLVVLISARHITRIVSSCQHIGRQISTQMPKVTNLDKAGMLPIPYIGIWTQPAEITPLEDVEINGHPHTREPLLADLWLPPEKENRSGLGIIYLHGSGWHYADKDFGTRPFFRHLCSQGHIVLDLAYTLAPKADLVRMVGDVKFSILWMKENARALGIDPLRIVLAGGSAGGQLALLAGYTPNHPQLDSPEILGDTSVCGVVSYYGPTNLREQYMRFNELPGLTGRNRFERAVMRYLEARFGFESIPVHNLLPAFLGGSPEEVPELYSLASPQTHVSSSCPPTLLLQGLHDFSGAAPQVSSLHQALKAAGCTVFLLELPDAEHGFDLYKPRWSPAAQGATYVTERFLAGLSLSAWSDQVDSVGCS